MQQRDLEQQLRFGLAARELHGGDRLVHLREPELQLRGLPVERQPRGAVAGGRAERVLVDAPQRSPRVPAASSRISAAKPRAHSATELGMACCRWV